LCSARAETFIVPDLHALRQRELVAMYRIDGASPAAESAATIQVIAELTERMRRLAEAYGEWREFDSNAYFDLTPAQTQSLLYLRERVSTVHLRFDVDVLLPSFQRAVRYWDECYAPTKTSLRQAVTTGHPADAPDEQTQQAVRACMADYWRQAQDVIVDVRRALADDIAYLSMRGAGDEQSRWQQRWQQGGAAGELDSIVPPLRDIPTLTLVFDFPLPPARQPGRLRRLHRHRTRRQRRNRFGR
jgi:hypothetical protein